jgi:hypothetical protein
MKIIQNILFYLSISLLLFTSIEKVNSQNLNGAFIMSSVGSIPNLSNNSMAVNFTSNASCFRIQNGAAVLIAPRGKGKFTNYCIENIKNNTLGIKMFPNPVVNEVQVKLSKLPPVEEVFNWSIWTTEGTKITGEKTTGYELFQGKMINLSGLHSGIFMLQVESNNYKEILKFIKAR